MATQVNSQVNSAQAVRKWSAALGIDVKRMSFFNSRMIGRDENSIIEEKRDLASGEGDLVQFDLLTSLKQRATVGDAVLSGNTENMKFYVDEIKIDQIRGGVSTGGRMTKQRTIHNLRRNAKNLQGKWWAEFLDEMVFSHLSGHVTTNADAKFDLAAAVNPIRTPDAEHILYGGSATSKASLTSADEFSRALVERANVKADMMNAVNPDVPKIEPVTIEGAKRYVTVINKFQEHALRMDNSATGWFEIQKALATSEGRQSPLVRGGVGMIDNTVIHCHSNVLRFSDYGAGSNLPAARALFLGRQAGVIAYGAMPGSNQRFFWNEETSDFGNKLDIAVGSIVGVSKTRYRPQDGSAGTDFGVIALDTHAKDPNA